MNLNQVLSDRMAEIDRSHLRRHLHTFTSVEGACYRSAASALLNFSSNDYLGLSQHPQIREAAAKAAREFGGGATASRLVCGSLRVHEELEETLAEFKHANAALAFSSGYATALGTVPALVGSGDYVVLDRLSHACLVDAARLSRAQLRVFGHNDVGDLDDTLRSITARLDKPGKEAGNILILTESVFSMDGDCAPLREIVQVKNAHGAWLMVDEAHATGCYGTERSGLIEEEDLGADVDIAMGTLSKAIGAAGGFITGSRALCDYLLHRGRSFMFSTAPPPAVAAAALASLRIIKSAEGAQLCAQLWERVGQLKAGLTRLGWDLSNTRSPILPLIIGEESEASRVSDALRKEGFLIPAIRYPTVPKGEARLRVTVSAAHTGQNIEDLLRTLERLMDKIPARSHFAERSPG